MNNQKETKQKLIDATKQMIDEGGVESVSLREIGKIVELSRSAVYRHFKSKEDMLSAVVLENFQALKTDISNIISRFSDPMDILAALMKHYYHFGIHNPEHYRLMFCSQYDEDRYPEVHVAARHAFDAVSACIIEALKKNRMAERSAKELTAMAYSFIHGLILLNTAGHTEPEKGLDDPDGLINSFLRMMFSRIDASPISS